MRSIRRDWLQTFILLLGATIFLFPLFWMVSTSFKSLPELTAYPPRWLPGELRWSNYKEALTFLPFDLFAKNTVTISVLFVIGSTLSSSLVGFGFAYYRFPGRDALFTVLLATMMLPMIVRLIPLYLAFQRLGWVNTFLPLVLPAFFAVEAFFVFLMRQFYRTIPRDLVEAARIDGCSDFRIWWNIILPVSKPALAAVAIFSFQHVWNDFIPPLVFLHDQKKKTLALGLYALLGQTASEAVNLWNYAMAAAVVIILPMVVVFLLFQRYFIKGTVMSGIKG